MSLTLKELAKAHGVSLATIKRYKRAGAPLEDAQALQAWKQSKRSRRFVSKFMSKIPPPQPAPDLTDELDPAEFQTHAQLAGLRGCAVQRHRSNLRRDSRRRESVGRKQSRGSQGIRSADRAL